MSNETDPDNVDADLIDAEYEPASPVISQAKTKRSGPGWLALGLTGLLATALGAAGGTIFTGQVMKSDDNGVLIAGETAEKLSTLETELASVRSELKSTESKLSDVLNTTAGRADDTKTQTALDELRSEVNDFAREISRFDADLESLDGRVSEQAEADGTDADRVLERLDALERIGDDGDAETTPRQANRALRVLERRLDEQEGVLASRRDETQTLSERLEELQLSLSEGSEAGTGEEAADMGAEVDALREDVSALEDELKDVRDGLQELTARGAEVEGLRQLTEELQEQLNADADDDDNQGTDRSVVFAMMSIESAARNGRAFQPAYAQLAKAVPGNRAINSLRSFSAKTVPTLATLQAEYSALRPKALEAHEGSAKPAPSNGTQSGQSSGGTFGWMQNVFGDAVVIRKSVDEPDQDSAVDEWFLEFEKADAAIASGQLGDAIDIVGSYDPAAREVYSTWLKQARERVALDAALDDVRLALAEQER